MKLARVLVFPGSLQPRRRQLGFWSGLGLGLALGAGIVQWARLLWL